MKNFERLFDAIGAMARRRHTRADSALIALGLNHTEARLLTLLQQEGGSASQDVLSSRIFVDRTHAGRALKHLQQEGFVARRTSEADRRANVVQLTPKGRKAAGLLVRQRKTMAHGFFGDLTAEEAGVAADLIEKALR